MSTSLNSCSLYAAAQGSRLPLSWTAALQLARVEHILWPQETRHRLAEPPQQTALSGGCWAIRLR